MSATTISLSVEELTLALAEAGHAEAGRLLLAEQLGELSQSEMEAALLGAAHSLLARGFATSDDTGVIGLAPMLTQMAVALMEARFSIRFTGVDGQGELNHTYHWCGDTIIAQRVAQGLVHQFAEVSEPDVCIEGGATLLGVPGARPYDGPQCVLLGDVLNEFAGDASSDTIAQRLSDYGAPVEICKLLAEDFAAPQLHGSVLRVEYQPDGAPVSEHGLLVLRGHDRLWLFQPELREGAVVVAVTPGDMASFREAVEALVA